MKQVPKPSETTGGQGGGLAESEKIATDAMPDITKRMVELALSRRPPRNVGQIAQAAKFVYAVALRESMASAERTGAAVNVVLVDQKDLAAVLAKRVKAV